MALAPLSQTILLTEDGVAVPVSVQVAVPVAGDISPDPDPHPPPDPLTITGTPPPTGQVGQPYSFTPSTAGGAGTKVYALASGTLLAGLSLNTSTGAITGTPTVAGTMTALSVRVTDDTGSASTTPTTVTIAAAAVAVTISGRPPTTGQVDQPYSFTPTVSNGSGTRSFVLASGTLLSGLAFSTTDGTISGLPKVAGTMSDVVVRVTDSTGSASTTATTVTIAGAAARAHYSDPYYAGTPYSRA